MPDFFSEPVIDGIYSTVGINARSRKPGKVYWEARRQGDIVLCRHFSLNYGAIGEPKIVPIEEFRQKYSFEPDFYGIGNFVRLEPEHGKQKVFCDRKNERKIRRLFQSGIAVLEYGGIGKARRIFRGIASLDYVFEEEHKFMFNDFGIDLRRHHDLEDSLIFFKKSLVLGAKDENIHFNIARVFFEQGNVRECLIYLFKILDLNPRHSACLKFLSFIAKKRLVPIEMANDLITRVKKARGNAGF